MHLPAVRLSDFRLCFRLGTAALLHPWIPVDVLSCQIVFGLERIYMVQDEPFDLLARGPLYSSFSIGFFTAGDNPNDSNTSDGASSV